MVSKVCALSAIAAAERISAARARTQRDERFIESLLLKPCKLPALCDTGYREHRYIVFLPERLRGLRNAFCRLAA